MARFISRLAWISMFAMTWLMVFGVMGERKVAAIAALLVWGLLALICAVSESAAERRARDAKGNNP